MENNNDIDRYTAKVLKNLEQEQPPANFTERLMDKILAEQSEHKKIESSGSVKFMLIFSAVFIPFFLIALLMPSGNFSFFGNMGITNNVFGNLQIDFGHFLNPIIQSLKESSFLKILPVTIITLIAIEQILIKIGDFKKV